MLMYNILSKAKTIFFVTHCLDSEQTLVLIFHKHPRLKSNNTLTSLPRSFNPKFKITSQSKHTHRKTQNIFAYKQVVHVDIQIHRKVFQVDFIKQENFTLRGLISLLIQTRRRATSFKALAFKYFECKTWNNVKIVKQQQWNQHPHSIKKIIKKR